MKTIEQRLEALEAQFAEILEGLGPAIVIMRYDDAGEPAAAYGNGRLIAEREPGEDAEAFVERVHEAAGNVRPGGVRIYLPDNRRGLALTPTSGGEKLTPN